MNERVPTKAPARRLGDEWIWVGFRGSAPSEHAGLELERLHVDELARLLLQAAEFRLRSASQAERWVKPAQDAVRLVGPRVVLTLEFDAWRSALQEQLEALHADGAALSPRLAELLGACLASAAGGGVDAARALEGAELRERSAPRAVATDSVRSERPFVERTGALERSARQPSEHASGLACARSGAIEGAAMLRRSEPAFERWPAARDLAQAARVLAPGARSHCALGRAHLAAGETAAARGCFRAALASTVDERFLREAQVALDELCRAPTLSSAVGAEVLDALHAPVPQL